MPGGMISIFEQTFLQSMSTAGQSKQEDGRGKSIHRFLLEAVGAFMAGNMSEEDFVGIERNACPSTGSCGGMYTANTMSSSFEALGMSLLYSSNMANTDQEKIDSASVSASVLVAGRQKRH